MDFSTDIFHCIEVLNKGGIILYPTDTIWGIGCDATNKNAVEKIITLKNRSENKSFIVLVTSEREVLKHTATLDLGVFDFLRNYSKPTTVIYENALGIAENVLAKDGSVAIRICQDDFCKSLIKRFQKPIVSTSANVSGEVSPPNYNSISASIKQGVDYCVKYRQDDRNFAQASSVIYWKNGKAIFLRE